MSLLTDTWVPGRLRSTASTAPSTAVSPDLSPQWFSVDTSALSSTAIAAGLAAGCSHVDVRITNTAIASGSARDGTPTGSSDTRDAGIAIRVLRNGRWGFAAATNVSERSVPALVAQAIELTEISQRLGRRPVELVAEPAHRGSWQSPFEIDPFEVTAHDRMALLIERSAALHGSAVTNTSASYLAVRESVSYADSTGTHVHQQRIRVHGEWTAIAVTEDSFDTMRSLAPPTARGWEFLLGPVTPIGGAVGWDWDVEMAAMPELLAEKVAAPGVEPGNYTLVLDPSHLWLTIHESVGHATELDRALGYEANYAGTTFATPEKLHHLRYGSALMNVTGDRVTPHALASVGFDDEGVAAQEWPIISEGVLTDYQLDRAMAFRLGRDRSNGCAYADSYAHVPIQRMPNVSLQPDPAGGGLDDLIAEVADGLVILGDDSWSIDMQRYNFQFTGQRAWRVRHGRVVGQVKDFAYQSSTPVFWNSLIALGGPDSFELGGAFNCGKGQPGQVAPVSHGCPPAVFSEVRVLNTRSEGQL